MSRFNTTTPKTHHYTHEGANCYKKDSVSNFFEFAFGNLLGNGFYETGDEKLARLNELTTDVIDQYGPAFAAKTAIFARNEIGIRSVSAYIAAILNGYKFDSKRNFYSSYFHRIDDIAEIFGAVDSLGQKRSHALVRGSADYLEKQKPYQLAKYQMKGKEYNLHDIINLVHAKSSAIDDYQNNRVAPAETWEVKISTAKSPEEKNKQWLSMLHDDKLGYLALLRNVRNILSAIEEVGSLSDVTELCTQLTNETAIRKSLVFPYQIYSAYKNCNTSNIDIVKALNDAFKISISNMPELSGKNLYILDVSGSMDDKISYKSDISIKEAAAVYATAAFLAGNGDFLKFGNDCKKIRLSRLDNPFEIVSKMKANDNCGYGTDISTVFDWLDKNTHPEYDRYFIFSDMQTLDTIGWYNYKRQVNVKYRINKYLANHQSHWYSFDISSYNTTVFNPWNNYVHGLTSLSDKVFQLIPLIESGESGMVDYINTHVSF